MNSQQYSTQLKRDFDRDGYIAIRNFFSREEIDELWREIERYKREVAPELEPTEHLYEDKSRPETLKYLKHIDRYDPYFGQLFASDRFVNLAKLLMDDDVVCDNMALFNKPPRIGKETPPHQDGYYFMLEPMEGLTMWLALETVDEENGCVRYVTGSHLRGMREHNKTNTLGFSQGIGDYGTSEDQEQEVAMRAQPGDLLVHHCMTIHRADPNLSDRTRHSLGLVYYAARARVKTDELKKYQQSLNRELATAGRI
jgi:phytanoyl-CoA hydroxylase